MQFLATRMWHFRASSRTGRPAPVQIAEFRAELNAWLDAHAAELAPTYAAPGTLDEHIAQMQRVKSMLYDAGWMRWGWPERVGGLGGSPMLRTELGAAIAARDLTDPGLFSLVEVLAPTLIDFAAPELAADVVPRLLSGAELWCQGFSEPGTGSDLSALSCRAVPDGDPATAATWVDQRPEGVDEPGAVLGPLRAAHAHRARRTRATAASPRSSSTWTRPGSPSRRSR